MQSGLDPVLQFGGREAGHAQTKARECYIAYSFVLLLLCSAVRQSVEEQTDFHKV